MEAKSKWLTEDGNIVAPNTLDSCVFGSDGKSLEEKLPFKFGIDENGKYGYFKTNEETVTPFGTGGAGSSGLGDCELIWSGLTELDTSQHDISLNKSIDDYDYLLISYWNLASSSGCQTSNTILIPKEDFYLKATIPGYENQAFAVGDNLASTAVIYLTFAFKDNVTLTYKNGTTSDGYKTAIRAIYGIKKAGLHNYSTEEKVVGTWRNKPVYQKTFVDIPITSFNTWIYLTNEGNIEELLFINGSCIRDGEPISFGMFNANIYSTAIVRNNNLAVLMNGISGETYSIKNITVQYTKTTDTATT